MVKYIVNEQERKVTAVIDGCKYMLVDKAKRMFGRGLSDSIVNALIVKDVFKATANCDIRDTFDAEVGKIKAKKYLFEALNDAEVKAKKRLIRVMERNVAVLGDFVTTSNDADEVVNLYKDLFTGFKDKDEYTKEYCDKYSGSYVPFFR